VRKGELIMQTQTQTYVTRQDRIRATHSKQKKKKPWLYLFSFFLFFFATSIFFVYGTESGHQLRLMAAGSILSSQHPQYARFLLSEAEIGQLKELIAHPPTQRSTVPATAPAPVKSDKPLVQVETVETSNYVAKVMKISDPTTVHLATTKYSNKGEPLSTLITDHGAVAGINAGGFEDQNGNGSGGHALGIVISNGNVLSVPNGNRSESQLVGGFTRSGEFITGAYSVNELENLGVTEAVSFGPQLLVDGKDVVTNSVDAAYGWAPRTVIGQEADGTVVMIITDGRFFNDKRHRGASMEDMAHLLQQNGVQNAIALDGGGSTTMINKGELQLKPATFTDVGMRYLPNAFVVVPHDGSI
jgi:exopolysaccharide biosynthesis protein